MTTATTVTQSGQPLKQSAPWFVLLAGWAAMFGPTYWDLAGGTWRSDDQFHGAIILVVIAWLIWDRRLAVVSEPAAPRTLSGSLLFGFGLVLYILGRSQDILLFEVGAQIPVLAGALLILQGGAGLRALWFPIIYFVFMVPLPGALIDAMTGPLKQWVSVIAEHLLYAFGYPIARSGVMLSIGQYQLLVADACSGLNSMFSLSALGLLYMYLMARKSWLHNSIMLLSILPIAFTANIVRVIVLVLITYHLGDEEGQGFLHGTAGILLLLTALFFVIALDAFLRHLLLLCKAPNSTGMVSDKNAAASKQNEAKAPLVVDSGANRDRTNHPKSMTTRGRALGLALLVAVALASVLTPKPIPATEQPDLDSLIPRQFGNWTIDPNVVPVLPSPDQQKMVSETYDQLVNRTYVNSDGRRMMLSIAYGSRQDQRLKAHRQEVCYAAQGFNIRNLHHTAVNVAGATITATRMMAISRQREEPVTYWFTVGDQVVQSHAQRFWAQLQYGLSGTIPDGVLVRISNLTSSEQVAYQAHIGFINELLEAMPPESRARFVGTSVR